MKNQSYGVRPTLQTHEGKKKKNSKWYHRDPLRPYYFTFVWQDEGSWEIITTKLYFNLSVYISTLLL